MPKTSCPSECAEPTGSDITVRVGLPSRNSIQRMKSGEERLYAISPPALSLTLRMAKAAGKVSQAAWMSL